MYQIQERSLRLPALGFVSRRTQLRAFLVLLSPFSGTAPWAAAPKIGLECKTPAAFSSLYKSIHRWSQPYSPSPHTFASWSLSWAPPGVPDKSVSISAVIDPGPESCEVALCTLLVPSICPFQASGDIHLEACWSCACFRLLPTSWTKRSVPRMTRPYPSPLSTL